MLMMLTTESESRLGDLNLKRLQIRTHLLLYSTPGNMDEKSQMLLKLEALKKELAAKSEQLKKTKHRAKVKEYVRKKVKELNDLDNLGIGSSVKTLASTDGDKTPCENVHKTPVQTTSIGVVHDRMGRSAHRSDTLSTQTTTRSSRTRKRGSKSAAPLSPKHLQSSVLRTHCDSGSNEDMGGGNKRVDEISEECHAATVPNNTPGAAKYVKAKSQSCVLRGDKDLRSATDIDKMCNPETDKSSNLRVRKKSKGKSGPSPLNTDIACNSISNSSDSLVSKSKEKSRPSSLDTDIDSASNASDVSSMNDVIPSSPVGSGKRNHQIFMTNGSGDFSSSAKNIYPSSNSGSSAIVKKFHASERNETSRQRFSQNKGNTVVKSATLPQLSNNSNKQNGKNFCINSDAIAPKAKTVRNDHKTVCEDSLSFITPSFQSEKQGCDVVASADRIHKTARGDIMSNADFLNVLGVSQNDYDSVKSNGGVSNLSGRKSNYCVEDKVTNVVKVKVDGGDAIEDESCSRSEMTIKPLSLESDPASTDFLTDIGNHKNDTFCEKPLNSSWKETKSSLSVNKLNASHKPLTLKSHSFVSDHIESPSNSMSVQSQPIHLVTDSHSSATTNSTSTLTSDYTELDFIPYSQFELTEDFLSETPSSQTDASKTSRKGKGKRWQAGPLIKRKSPRLSSGLFPWKTLQVPSSDTDSQSSADSVLRYKSKRSLPSQRKAAAVMSVFQLLVDNAKNKSSKEDYELPTDFLPLIEAKANKVLREDINQVEELESDKICVTRLGEKQTCPDDICVIEDSEVIDDVNEEVRERNFLTQDEVDDKKPDDSRIMNKEIFVIEDSEVVESCETKESDGIEKERVISSCGNVTKEMPMDNHPKINVQAKLCNEPPSEKNCEANVLHNKERNLDNHGEQSAVECIDINTVDILQQNKPERILSAIGGDADHELMHGSVMREVDDCSVIQSSYQETPVKHSVTGQRNRMARRSLKTSLLRGRNSLARLAVNNSNINIAKNDAVFEDKTDVSTKLDGCSTLTSEMRNASKGCTDQRAESPVGSHENFDLSPKIKTSLVSSSTPKLNRHSSSVFAVQDALSPIESKLLSPLLSKNIGDLPVSRPMSTECDGVRTNTLQYKYKSHSLDVTPNPKQIQQPLPFSPIEKSDTSGFHEGDCSLVNEDCYGTLKADCPNGESHKDVVMHLDGEDSFMKNDSNVYNSVSETNSANSTSKTETRLTVGANEFQDIHVPLSERLPENKLSSLSKSLENAYSGVNSKSTTPGRKKSFDVSDGKSPFSKYLEESVVSEETNDNNETRTQHSPTHVSPWHRIPKTSSTPLQIFETSCTASPRLLSPIFTPSRMSRSRGRTSAGLTKNKSKKTLKFDGCFQSCSEDAVIQLLHGKLLIKETPPADHVDGGITTTAIGGGIWKRYLVSVQASALTVWMQNDDQGNDWSPELDWRLSATTHILHASILPTADKIAIAASGWEKTQPIVTVFVYDFVRDDTLRFNIPHIEHASDLSVSQIHLCPFLTPSSSSSSSSLSRTTPSQPQLLLGISSDTHHTPVHVVFQSDFQGVTDSKVFDKLHRGKLNSLLLCHGQGKACVSLTWDQRITLWNTEHRMAIQTVSIPSYLPCLTALVDVRVVKGLLFLVASWRVEDVGDCGGIMVWNPVTGCLAKTRVWNIPNAGWRSTEKTNKVKKHIYSTSSSGSVSWWDERSGAMVGYRQSNIATCVSGMDDKHLVVGEMHGCVHLYSMY